jgi:predicted HicB family RNase H-like nuclease
MSNKLKYKGYTGSVEYSAEDNCFFGRVEGMVKDAITYEGISADELKKDFEDAVNTYLMRCEEKGIKPRKPFSGILNVRINPVLHERLADIAGFSGSTLNTVINYALNEFSCKDKEEVTKLIRKAH